MKILCVILARSGSKRCPDKNIRPFAGTTLSDITLAQACRLFDYVAYSSDSDRYLELAMPYKKVLPVKRPAHLANDSASSESAIMHATMHAEEKFGCEFNAVALLEVTSPLRKDISIETAVRVYKDSQSPPPCFVIKTVIRRPYLVKPYTVGYDSKFQLAGGFYMWNRYEINSYHPLFTVQVSEEEALNIDTEFDFKLTEFAYELAKTKD